MSKCECEFAGWCERHKINKSQMLHRKCQNDEQFWNAWEERRGPGQAIAQTRKIVPVGPGTMLARELKIRGYTATTGCGCGSKVNKMNRWGAARCRSNIEEITEWIVEAAKKHNWLAKIAVSIPLVGDVARYEIKQMILHAIDAAEAYNSKIKLEEQNNGNHT